MGWKKDCILLDLQAYSHWKNFPKCFGALKAVDFQLELEVYLLGCNNGPSLPFAVFAITGGCSHSIHISLLNYR